MLPIRRSRGYAPEPLPLAVTAARPLLGCGAELKSTFCLARGRHAFLSHHIGDLENYETLRSFTEGIEHFRRLFDVRARAGRARPAPGVPVHEVRASSWTGVELLGVQHHHAHIASCLADNGEAGPVIGIACDGPATAATGRCGAAKCWRPRCTGFRRLAHLEPVPLPGGATAIRQPWRMASSWLHAAYGGEPPDDLDIRARNAAQWPAVRGARTPRSAARSPAAPDGCSTRSRR